MEIIYVLSIIMLFISYILIKKTDKKVDIIEYYDLPYRYNQTIVKLLAQTPNTLFIYWDISDMDRENFKKQYGDNFFDKTRPVLIVHNDTMQYSFEIEINDFATSWYLHVQDANCNYRIELGRRPIPEYIKNEPIALPDYFYVSISNPLTSPNDHILFSDKDILIRNMKTNNYYRKSISTFKIKNIYTVYQKLYKEENEIGNPSSGNIHIRKF